MGCLLWNNGIKEQRGEKGLNRWLYCEAASSPPTTQITCTEGSFRPSSNGSAVDTAFLIDRANGELGTFWLGYAGTGCGSKRLIRCLESSAGKRRYHCTGGLMLVASSVSIKLFVGWFPWKAKTIVVSIKTLLFVWVCHLAQTLLQTMAWVWGSTMCLLDQWQMRECIKDMHTRYIYRIKTIWVVSWRWV